MYKSFLGVLGAVTAVVGIVVLWLGPTVIVLYVLWHFISKYW